MDSGELEKIREGSIKGRRALKRLEETGEYLFHGSDQRLESLEPRQGHQLNKETGEKIPDGEPAVFAATLAEPAIFKAMIRNKIDGEWSGWDIQQGESKYSATQTALDRAKDDNVRGFVYVFRRSDFQPYRGMEYVSRKEVNPFLVVEVGGIDLPEKIDTVEPRK